MSLFEAQTASEVIAQEAGREVNVIFGTSIDKNLGDSIRVTVITTGFAKKPAEAAPATNAKGKAANLFSHRLLTQHKLQQQILYLKSRWQECVQNAPNANTK